MPDPVPGQRISKPPPIRPRPPPGPRTDPGDRHHQRHCDELLPVDPQRDDGEQMR